MKSASSALVWEIWRKNRWGFVLLGLLFVGCAGMNALVARQQKRDRIISNEILTSGTLTAQQVLPLSPTGLVERVVRFKVNSGIVYEGPFSASNEISWSNDEEALHLKIRLTPPTPKTIITENPNNPSNAEHATNSLPSAQEIFQRRYGFGTKSGLAVTKDIWRTFAAGPFSGAQSYTLSWSIIDGEGKGAVVLRPYWNEQHGLLAAYSTFAADNWRESGLPWSTAMMGFSVLALFVIFGGTEPQEGRGFTGIPPRRFTLPARTTTLVTWPLLLGSVSILLMVVAWSRFVFPPLLDQGIQMPERYLALLFLASLSVFQAVVWGLPSFPKTRATLLTVLICALLGMVIFRFSNPQDSFTAIETGFVIAWFIGLATAGFGVRLERRGAWASWQRGSALGNLFRRAIARRGDFRSALHAQVWFEWRRNCRVPLLIWTLVLWLVLGATLASSARPDFSGALIISLLASLGFLAIAGLNLARDVTSKKLLLSSFTATRPVTTGDLLLAKLLAGLKLWLCAILIFGFSVFIASCASRQIDLTFGARILPGETLQGIFIALCVISVSLHVFVGILPLCLSGKIHGFPWSLLPLLLLIGLVVNAWRWLDHAAATQELICAILTALVVLKLIATLWGFRTAIARHLVSRTFIATCVILWLIGTGICLLTATELAAISFAQYAPNVPGTGLIIAMFLAALLAIPLARLALSPMAFTLNRHR